MYIKEDLHSKLLCLGLSSLSKELRIKKFTPLWKQLKDEAVLLHLAQRDEVAGHIAFLLDGSNLNYSSGWIEEAKKVEKKVSTLMNTLEDVATLLNDHNVNVVALKNAGITKGIYKNFSCSPMGDIDLLVSITDFHTAHHILVNKMGFTFKFRSELEDELLEEAFRNGGTEYFKEVAGDTVWLELQWRPVAGRWIQPHNEPNGDDLLFRSVAVEGSLVRILAAEDNLLQVALHTAKHSYCRAPGFRLHSDVDRIVRYQNVRWDIFMQRTTALKLKTAVYFSLFFAKELLETPIPNDVLGQLKPNLLRRKIVLHLISKAGIFNQHKKKFSKTDYIIFNLMLYDSLTEVFKAIFPPFEALKSMYGLKTRWQMPLYYFKRIKGLLTKRAKL